MLKKIKLNYIYILYVYIFITPLFFSLLFERQREEDFIFCLISSFYFVLPAYLIKRATPYVVVSSLALLCTGLFDLVHIYLYQGRISSSIFFIILDTNPAESSEFIGSNITLGLVGAICFYLIFYLGALYKAINQENTFYKKGLSIKLLLLLLAPLATKYFTSSYNISKTIEAYTRSNQFFLMTKTYISYKEQMKIFTDFDAKAKKITNVTRGKVVAGPETHVLVIGESTTSRHMSLYGYQRKTTPLMDMRKEELIIFKDVANSHPPGTASNLKRINTLANSEVESAELLSISLVNIMKAGGFKTYWLSNQLILGLHDTVTTALAKQADVPIFTNTTDSKTYDEKLLPILERKLNEKVDKKFIIVHLLGTHMKYRNRFPEGFDRFKTFDDITKKSFHTPEQLQYINDYDNSVYYNDYILDQILKRLQTVKGVTSFIYLSDHGEEVYESKPLHGHPSVDTKGIYEIPFIFWGSEMFKKEFAGQYQALKENTLRPFAHDDLIHGLMDLYAIKYARFDPSLSFLNKLFKPKLRYLDRIRAKEKKEI